MNPEAILRSTFLSKFIFASLITIWILSYLRIFFGADVTDEAQYVASAYLPVLGGKPFVNELYIQQTASLIYTPFVWIYSLIFGSMTGVILAIRHLYFIFAGLTALSAYKYFCLSSDRLVAFALSTLFATFVPFCIPSLSYNTMGYLGINCFFIWSAFSLHHSGLRAVILSGIFASLTVWVYPTLVLPIMAFYVLAILIFFNQLEERCKILYSFFTFSFIMISTLPLLLLVGRQNLELVFNFSRASGAGGGFEKVSYAFETLISTLPPWYIFLPFILFWLGLVGWKKISSVWLFAGITILYLVFCLSAAPQPTTIFASHLHLWLLSLFAALIVVYNWFFARSSQGFQKKSALLPIALSGLFGSLVLTASSSMTYYPAIYPLVFILLLALHQSFRTKSKVPLAYLLLLNISTLALSYGSTYRDESILTLDHLVHEGPYAGIITSASRAQLLHEVQMDLNSVAQVGKTIFFLDSFPAGYLMSNLVPQTRSLFMHPLPTYYWLRPFYADYYQQADHRPDIIFDFKFIEFSKLDHMNFHYPDEKSSGDVLRSTLYRSGLYKKITERNSYSVFIRQQ